MSRVALYQLAREHREKYLVSHKIMLAKHYTSVKMDAEQVYLLDADGNEVTSDEGIDLGNHIYFIYVI